MSSALCLCCHLSLFLEADLLCLFLAFLLSLWSVHSSALYVREVNSLTVFFLFCLLACLSVFLLYFLPCLPSNIFCLLQRCSIALEFINPAHLFLYWILDIVSVLLKSNGFRTGKALISAAHCCLCVDARC